MPDGLLLIGVLLVVVAGIAVAVVLREDGAPPVVVRPVEQLPYFRRLLGRAADDVPPPFEPSPVQILQRLGVVEEEAGGPPEAAVTGMAMAAAVAVPEVTAAPELPAAQPLDLATLKVTASPAPVEVAPAPADTESTPVETPTEPLAAIEAAVEPAVVPAVEPEPAAASDAPVSVSAVEQVIQEEAGGFIDVPAEAPTGVDLRDELAEVAEVVVDEPLAAVAAEVVVDEPLAAVAAEVVPEPTQEAPAAEPANPPLAPKRAISPVAPPLAPAPPPPEADRGVAAISGAAAGPSRSLVDRLGASLRGLLARPPAVTPEPAVEPQVEPAPTVLAPALPSPTPQLMRILNGEHGAFERVVVELSAGDPGEAARWRAFLEQLFEVILERALATDFVSLPANHPFWGSFSPPQARGLLAALASLGFHFDGLGGWLDDRVPAKRDLAVAVGYIGFEPIRIRTWPTPAEMPGILADAVIAGGEYLTETAPSLTEQELKEMLDGRGGSRLTLPEDWERARTVLLSET